MDLSGLSEDAIESVRICAINLLECTVASADFIEQKGKRRFMTPTFW